MTTVIGDANGLRSGTAAAPADRVSIRGVELRLDQFVDAKRLEPASVSALKQAFAGASPFPHLVIDGLFNAELLHLVAEEFTLLAPSRWRRSQDGMHERTTRSLPRSRLGHAAEAYFGVLHSSRFIAFLEQVTGIADLITDPHLHNAGFHESRRGDRFRIHTDFNKHASTRLDNELVLLTYLNPHWDPAWGGALELWSAEPRACVRRIDPLFGRTVLMRYSPVAFHGHPQPLQAPADEVRRSLAAYYYGNREERQADHRQATRFMDRDTMRVLRIGAREVVPPVLWKAVKRLFGR